MLSICQYYDKVINVALFKLRTAYYTLIKPWVVSYSLVTVSQQSQSESYLSLPAHVTACVNVWQLEPVPAKTQIH